MFEIIGKIFIILIGIFGLALLLLILAAACDLMAKTYRETHKDYFENNDNESNN